MVEEDGGEVTGEVCGVNRSVTGQDKVIMNHDDGHKTNKPSEITETFGVD